jgi:hypothetical protein
VDISWVPSGSRLKLLRTYPTQVTVAASSIVQFDEPTRAKPIGASEQFYRSIGQVSQKQGAGFPARPIGIPYIQM